jgi:hypothetical protein
MVEAVSISETSVNFYQPTRTTRRDMSGDFKESPRLHAAPEAFICALLFPYAVTVPYRV